MTKRKRTVAPAPAPRKRVFFDIPQSLWSFQAVARELVRQSELRQQQIQILQEEQLRNSQRPALDGLHFDTQSFQNKSLRFSPYPHQPCLPSRPLPQAARFSSGSIGVNAERTGSVDSSTSKAEGALGEGASGRVFAGSEDHLFDELTDALQSEQLEGEHGPGPPSQYLTGGNRITFDTRLAADWEDMRPEPYQSFMQNYPQMISPTLQTHPISTPGPHPPHISANNSLSNPCAHQTPPFYHQPPSAPQNGAQTQSNMSGYYEMSIKLLSQAPQNGPSLHSTPPSQPAYHFGLVTSAYPPVPYT